MIRNCCSETERPAHAARGGLGYVDGHDHPGAPHGQPEDEAGDRQECGAGGERRGQRPHHEDHRRRHDCPPAPDAVGEGSAAEGAEDGAEQQRGYDYLLPRVRELEVVLDEEQRAGDDARVVAEEQPAEGRDGRHVDETIPSATRGITSACGHATHLPLSEPSGREQSIHVMIPGAHAGHA